MTKAALIPLLGAGAGAMMNKDDPMKGALLGLLGGAAAGPAMAGLSGAAAGGAGGIAGMAGLTPASASLPMMGSAAAPGAFFSGAAPLGGQVVAGSGAAAGGGLSGIMSKLAGIGGDMSPMDKMKLAAQMQGQGQQQPQAAPAMPPQMGGQPSQAAQIAQMQFQRQNAHMGNSPMSPRPRQTMGRFYNPTV